jgi:hypothetical protein
MDLKLVALPLYEARSWMKLLGVVMVITGILTALTIVFPRAARTLGSAADVRHQDCPGCTRYAASRRRFRTYCRIPPHRK